MELDSLFDYVCDRLDILIGITINIATGDPYSAVKRSLHKHCST